jgi:hypothetical protein
MGMKNAIGISRGAREPGLLCGPRVADPSRMWRSLVCVLCAALRTGGSVSQGEDRSVPKLLPTRPAVPFIEVSQLSMRSVATETGFLVSTPTLKLAEVIEAAGGFQSRSDRVWIKRVLLSRLYDLTFSKNQVLQERGVQSETFLPGDRGSISFIIKPW